MSWSCPRLVVVGVVVAMAMPLASCSTSSQGKGAMPSSSSSSTPRATGAGEAAIASRAHSWGEKLQVAKVRCLRDAGWDANLDTDFSITGKVPPEQRGAFERDVTGCESNYESEFPKPPLTASDLTKMYARELTTVRCLEKQGYPPVSDPISEQQYVQQMQAQGFTSWRAYDAVPSGAAADFARIEKVCPQPGAL